MSSELDGENRPDPKAVPDRFDKFALSIERSGAIYRVRVIDAPVGSRAPVEIDFSALEGLPEPGAGGPSRGRDVRRRAAGGDTLRREGEKLFRAVFTGDVADAFRGSLERARSQGHGLLIQLHFEEAPETASLLWEALWDPTERTFLADMADVPIVRGLSVTSQAATVAPAVPPLRILALLPEPPGRAELSGADEWARIRRHLGDLIERGQVHVERVEPPSLTELGRRLQVAGCDVLHIVAHGSGGGDGTAGTLQLETAGGELDEVSGAELARALERQQPPRLVVLSACHGASAADNDAFDGLAQLLLARGVPAVVAMHKAISDAAAVEFASALYRQLAAGRTAEAAVIEARRELGLSEQRTEWATPVLYLRGANVRIFATELLPLIDAPEEPARRSTWRLVVFAALLLFGLLVAGWRLFQYLDDEDASRPPVEKAVDAPGGSPPTEEGHERCPAPPGFADLRFALIEPGLVKAGDRTLVVEEFFCIGTREVTRRDWAKVMGEYPWQEEEPQDWPANYVTLTEARDLATRLRAMDPAGGYRLPDEIEWEYAARAGAETRFFFGDDEADLSDYGNCKNPRGKDGADTLNSVGSYRPNRFGLYDVHGNVSEWVEPAPAGAPAEAPRRLFDEEKNFELALRLGGSFENPPQNCSFDFRSEVKLADERDEAGFRLVREPDPVRED